VSFFLTYRGREFPLDFGEWLLGRSTTCTVVLEDPLASRFHARVVVDSSGAWLEDNGSRNGVKLNGKAISERVSLESGDEITIGTQTLSVVETSSDSGSSHSAPTQRHDAFEVLQGVIDKALSLGRAEQAERMAAPALEQLLAACKAGMPRDEAGLDRAAAVAARVAAATNSPKWVDFIIALYASVDRVPPAPIVDVLYTTAGRMQGVDVAALRHLVERLRSRADTFAATERFALGRLEGLHRLIVS
jgi:hypothetical protein